MSTDKPVIVSTDKPVIVSTDKPVIVSANAGLKDSLQGAFRMVVIIVTAIPVIQAIVGKRDLLAMIAYLQGTAGGELIGALSGLAAIFWGLWKSHRRGAQLATVAADPRTPDAVAQIKTPLNA